MELNNCHCPKCQSKNYKTHTSYTVSNGEERNIYRCQECGNYFSQTKNTPLAGLRKPLSFIIPVLEAVNGGMSINAACRTFGTSKKSIKRWLSLLGEQKETKQ
jgi:transposase-like protein